MTQDISSRAAMTTRSCTDNAYCLRVTSPHDPIDDPLRHVPLVPAADTEIYVPDIYYRTPGTFVHPDANPASTHDFEGGKLSGKHLNVQRRANHGICE